LPHHRGMNKQPMSKARLEAFSDGVIAIIITIMVLELKVPHGADAASLLHVWPVFLSYLLSFLVVAIYWVNHHRLFHDAHHASTGLLWSNNALLFCLSLIPFSTGYMGENDFAPFPTALYAGTLLLAGLAFIPVRWSVIEQLKDDADFLRLSTAAKRKNYVSLALYAVSIPLAFVHPALTLALAFIVAAIYFVPSTWMGEK
jgi:TMEM175 potassium channel family protein